jgi:Ca-activated chloride channel family protein
MLSFEHTEYLLGLFIIIPLALLFLFVLRWKKKTRKALGDEQLIDQLTKNYSAERYRLKFLLILSAVFLLIIAWANLRKPVAGEKEKKAGIDVVIALDLSKSMWAEDVKPSRLEASKQFINSLLDRLGDDRVGLVLFAGRAFLQMPLTNDFSVAKLYVSNASPDAVPMQGTVIGDALALSENSFNTQEKKYKSIILITDGEDHDSHAIEMLQQLADNGIIVNTIGVGSVEGSPIMEPGANTYKVDVNGQTVISKLNETELRQIAQSTGGVYQHLDIIPAAVNNISAVLDNMDKKAIQSSGDTKQYASFYPWFALIALLMLIAEIFIPETKRKQN